MHPKFYISFLLSLYGGLGIYAQTPNDSLVRAAAIVDGLFFDKSVPTKSLIPGNSTMTFLKDADGGLDVGMYLPEGFVLEESMKAKAIPAERFKDSKKLLRDYNGRKPQNLGVYEGIGVKVGIEGLSHK